MKFETSRNTDKKSRSTERVFVGKYKLYSFNVEEEYLSFSKYYIDKFQDVANNNSSDEEKSKELEKIFSSTGYFIPKKIYIGGMLISLENNFSKSKAKKNINFLDMSLNASISMENSNLSARDNSKFNEIINSSSTKIIGGVRSNNFENWIKSINLTNASIIECSNIISAKTILDKDLKKN